MYGRIKHHVQPLINPGLVTFEAWDAIRAGSIFAHLKAETSSKSMMYLYILFLRCKIPKLTKTQIFNLYPYAPQSMICHSQHYVWRELFLIILIYYLFLFHVVLRTAYLLLHRDLLLVNSILHSTSLCIPC